MTNKEQIATNKKTWQKPNFWILDTSIEGGAGINVKESTGVTTNSLPGQPGQPFKPLYTITNFTQVTANWTAAHS